MITHDSQYAFIRYIGAAILLHILSAGCASLPPRYDEPQLPNKDTATLTATGNGIGILLIDGAVPCDAAEYNKQALSKKGLPSQVRVLPGPHELTVACWLQGGLTKMTTNIVVVAGNRYIVSRRLEGYSLSISFEPESK